MVEMNERERSTIEAPLSLEFPGARTEVQLMRHWLEWQLQRRSETKRDCVGTHLVQKLKQWLEVP